MLNKKSNNTNNKSKFNEKLSNENLFKSDIKYHLNKDLLFNSPIENQNCSFDIFKRKLPLIKYSLIIIFLKYSIYFSLKNYYSFFLTIIQILCFPLLIYIIKNLEAIENASCHAELEKQFVNLRLVFELLSIIYIYMKFAYKLEVNESTALDPYLALYHIFYSNFFNYLTNRNILSAVFWLLFKCLGLLSFTSRAELGLFSRCFTNLFSADSILLIVFVINSLFIECLKNRNMIELWGLYDSFKKSFCIFKRCLYDDFPNPIFIISRKQFDQILYKNKEADKLHEKISASKITLKTHSINNTNTNASGSLNPNQNQNSNNNAASTSTLAASGVNKRTYGNLNNNCSLGGLHKKNPLATRKINTSNKANNYSFSNLLEKEFEELFNNQVDKCIVNKKKYFYFPFPLYEREKTNLKYKESMRNITFFEGDLECFEWYKIIVSPCNFKNQESVLLQMLKEDCFYKEDFLTNFFTNLNYEFNVLIENVDKICDNIAEADFFFERREKLQIISKINNTNITNSGKEPISRNLGVRLNESNRDKTDLIRRVQRLKTLNFSSDNNKGKISRDMLIDLHNVQYPFLDYSLWFFFKNNSNSLYDSFLTLKVYNHLNSNKFLKTNFKITNLSNLIKYFDDLFFIASQKNSIDIISNLQGNLLNSNYCSSSVSSHNPISVNYEGEFLVVIEYLRAMIFNIYLFNLNNVTETSKKKELIVNYIVEKNLNPESNKYDLCLKINVSMEDESPIIDFNQLNLLLQKLNPIKNPKNENELLKNLDTRILIIYLISKVFYQVEFKCEREENINKMSVGILMQSKEFVKKQENLNQIQSNLSSSNPNNSGINVSSSRIINNNISNNGIVNCNLASPCKMIEKEFQEPKYHISEPYYVKLLNNTYGCQIEYKPRYKEANYKYQAENSDGVIDEIISNVTSEDDDDDDVFSNYDYYHNQDYELSKFFYSFLTELLFNLDCLNSDKMNARQFFAIANHFDNEKFEKCIYHLFIL